MSERRTNLSYRELTLREAGYDENIKWRIPLPIVPLFRTHDLTALTLAHAPAMTRR